MSINPKEIEEMISIGRRVYRDEQNKKKKEETKRKENQELLMEKAQELSEKLGLEKSFRLIADSVTNGTAEVVVGKVVTPDYCAVSYEIVAHPPEASESKPENTTNSCWCGKVYAGSDGLLSEYRHQNPAPTWLKCAHAITGHNSRVLKASLTTTTASLIRHGFIPAL